MDLIFWFSVTAACLLGAMSPGPSLVVVVNHALSQGRVAGLYAALAHGIAIGLFAFVTAFGLAVAIDNNPWLFHVIQLLGSLFLLLMAIKLLLSSNQKNISTVISVEPSYWRAARDGFLIALVNPKILLFFTALFSQFVRVDAGMGEKAALASIAAIVDTLWYMLVAVGLSNSDGIHRFQRAGRWLDKIFALLLLTISMRFIAELTSLF